MRHQLPNAAAATFFVVSIIYSISTRHPIAAAAYFLYATTWASLTYLTVDGELNSLPAREAFLDSLRPLKSQELLSDEKDCSICYDHLDPAMKLPCGHVFCGSCVARIFSVGSNDYRCPFCRRALLRMTAPWDTAVVKLFICTAVLRLVEDVLIASCVPDGLEIWPLTWWHVLAVPLFFCNFDSNTRMLDTVRDILDHNRLNVWEHFEARRWRALAPV